MRPVPTLALATLLAGYATVVLGGYVSSIGAGAACPDWPLCQGSFVPSVRDPGVLAEYLHRLAALLVGVFALVTLGLVWWKGRGHGRLVVATAVSVSLLVLQVALGFLTVATVSDPLVVTAHLGVATAFIATMTWATVLAYRFEPAPPRLASTDESRASGKKHEDEPQTEHEEDDERNDDADLQRGFHGEPTRRWNPSF